VLDVDTDPEELVTQLLGSPQPGDPYPIYAWLRAHAPVFASASGLCFVARYDDCQRVLRTPELTMALPGIARQDPRYDSSSYLRALSGMLMFTDPPHHTRLRKLINRAFTPRAVAALTPTVERLVDGYLDKLADLGSFDLVADMADALPSHTICALVGISDSHHERVVSWTEDISTAVATPALPDDILKAADRAVDDFGAYLMDLMDERRRSPEDDLISGLLAAREDGTSLAPAEMVNFVMQLLGAGVETTTHLLTIGTLSLLRNPDQLALLRDRPELIDATIEEILRYESPIQLGMLRTSSAPVLIGDTEVAPHSIVAALVGSANHDPEAFDEPHRFDITRAAGKASLTFGTGAHFCIGAGLARLQGRATIGRLVQRFPDLRLAGEPVWRDSFVMRGVHHLPLSTTS
jgi:cytochrome P450